ncbi:aminotransferase class III-fold pyridoxal phosphate-dependent enzyme [Roseibium salinum]|nr:aminotransferase class III-fold pyridoxal phosphate-dependent enzyme [Roseibium salinum]
MISDGVGEVFEKDETGKGSIGSGYTYSGHPVGAAAAIACLAETERLQVKDNAAARGEQLFRGLEALKHKHAVIGDVRGGHGLMCALELVADRETKAPPSTRRRSATCIARPTKTERWCAFPATTSSCRRRSCSQRRTWTPY